MFQTRSRPFVKPIECFRAGGWLAVFDGDYTTTTVSTDAFDPLQRAVDAMVANFVQNPWLTRRLGKACGRSALLSLASAVTATHKRPNRQYMLTIIDRGADVLARAGSIGAEHAAALKNEARRRVKEGEFFGHISFISLIARKPSSC